MVNRRLLTRRWGLITLSAIVIILACIRLGFWQLDRYHQRVDRNAATEVALAAEPVALTDMANQTNTAWRTVTVTGRYDTDNQVLLRYRPLDGQSGVHVLTPLVTDQGWALIIDRGFLAAEPGMPRTHVPDAPAPPSGDVDVVARLRASEESRGLGEVADTHSIRYVNVGELAEQLPYEVYGQWAELIDQSPTPPADLTPIPPPELTSGPSLLYAIQWWLFALIGVVGYVVLARGEARGEGMTKRGGSKPAPAVGASAAGGRGNGHRGSDAADLAALGGDVAPKVQPVRTGPQSNGRRVHK